MKYSYTKANIVHSFAFSLSLIAAGIYIYMFLNIEDSFKAIVYSFVALIIAAVIYIVIVMRLNKAERKYNTILHYGKEYQDERPL